MRKQTYIAPVTGPIEFMPDGALLYVSPTDMPTDTTEQMLIVDGTWVF